MLLTKFIVFVVPLNANGFQSMAYYLIKLQTN